MPRHGENIFKRKDKRWEGRCICGRKENGKAKYKSFYAHSYSECLKKMNDFKSKAEITEMKITVSHLFELWLENRKSGVKQSTYVNYRTLYENHIRDDIGNIQCENITAHMLSKYVLYLLENGSRFGGGLSVKSAEAVLIILKSMFAYGNSEYNLDNPAKRISLPRKETKEFELFDECEINKLCGLSDDNDPVRLGILLCLNTGIRIGEICALKWSDIDLKDNVLHIKKTLQRIKNPNFEEPKTIVVITEPKSRKSIRDIPIPTFLIPSLQRLRQDGDCYFLTALPSFTEPRCLSFKYKKCLNELGIKYRNFHCLRHTFATKCVKAGVDVKTLSELLGHSSVQITLDRYVHSDLDNKRVQIEKLSVELFSMT